MPKAGKSEVGGMQVGSEEGSESMVIYTLGELFKLDSSNLKEQ